MLTKECGVWSVASLDLSWVGDCARRGCMWRAKLEEKLAREAEKQTVSTHLGSSNPTRGLHGVGARLEENNRIATAEFRRHQMERHEKKDGKWKASYGQKSSLAEDRQWVSGERDEGQWRDRQHRRHGKYTSRVLTGFGRFSCGRARCSLVVADHHQAGARDLETRQEDKVSKSKGTRNRIKPRAS